MLGAPARRHSRRIHGTSYGCDCALTSCPESGGDSNTTLAEVRPFDRGLTVTDHVMLPEKITCSYLPVSAVRVALLVSTLSPET